MTEDSETKSSVEALIAYGEVFYQLLKLEWFKDIIDTRIDIHKILDEETKTMEIRVIEVPTEETVKRMRAKMEALGLSIPPAEQPKATTAGHLDAKKVKKLPAIRNPTKTELKKFRFNSGT